MIGEKSNRRAIGAIAIGSIVPATRKTALVAANFEVILERAFPVRAFKPVAVKGRRRFFQNVFSKSHLALRVKG